MGIVHTRELAGMEMAAYQYRRTMQNLPQQNPQMEKNQTRSITMNNLLFLGGYAIAFIVLMLPVEICNQLKPLRKRYYFLALLLMTVAYYLVIASFTGQWAKPLLWTLQEFLFLSGLLFMEEISNTLKSFWRRIRGK